MSDQGFLRLSRKFFKHPFWTEDRTFSLAEAWLDLVANARFEVAPERLIVKMKAIEINRGELRASQRFLSGRWNWSVGKVNRFIQLLENQGMIERRQEHSETIMVISNYGFYNPLKIDEPEQSRKCDDLEAEQGNERQSEHQREHQRDAESLIKPSIREVGGSKREHKHNGKVNTNGTPTDHQQIQTKEGKEGKESKEDLLLKIQNEFYNHLKPFVKDFGKEVVRDFYNYWSEPNKSKTKIRWQLEKTWDTRRRLQRWANNDFGNKSNNEPKEKEFQVWGKEL